MAEVRFHIWPAAPAIFALGDFGPSLLGAQTTSVQGGAEPGIVDALTTAVQSQPLIVTLAAMGLLVALVVLVQSLAMLTFGLDRLLRRRPPRPIGRWLRRPWEEPDD